METIVYDPDKRKWLSALSHGAIFFSPLMLSVGIPITLLLISDDPVIKENAKESINYHLNLWCYGLVVGFISFFWFFIITLPLIWFLGAIFFVMTWIVPVLAILKCMNSSDEAYRYRFILRLL